MNRQVSLGLLFTTAALLAACGGGGDTSGSSPSPSPSPSPGPVPAPPPTQTDLIDAAKTQFSGYFDQVDGHLTLQWLDTFPQFSSYLIQAKAADGSFSTIETVPGQGGQSGPMTWQHSPYGLSVLRIVANDQGRLTPIQTVHQAATLSVVTPPKPLSILIDQADPVTGHLDMWLSDSTPYGEVDWYEDVTQIAQVFDTPGAHATWDIGLNGVEGSHTLSAYLDTAADFQVRIHRRVAVSVSELDLTSSTWSSNGTTYVDIGNSSWQQGLVQVAAALDSGSQTILNAPNSCGQAPCGPNQSPTLYQFAYNEAAHPGAHTLHVAATGTAGATQDMGLLFTILPVTFTPADGAFVYGTLPLRGTATAGGSYSVNVSLDDKEILSGATTPFSLDYDLTGVAPGLHTLTVTDADDTVDAPSETHTVIVASSADLVYTPVMSLGSRHPTMLGADGDLLLYVADDGEHLRDVTTGADALLAGSAALANATAWQVDAGFAYAFGTDSDCVTSRCVYQWSPDGTRVNLTANDPNVSSYGTLVAKYGTVLWADDAGQDLFTFAVYDSATGTYSQIVDPYLDDSVFADIGLFGGVMHVYYCYEYGIYDWSSATGQITLIGGNYYPYNVKTDGVRVVYASDGFTFQIVLGISGSATGPGQGGSNLSVRDGVDSWLVYGTVKVEDPVGSTDVVGQGNRIYDTRGGYAVFSSPSMLNAWNAATGLTTLKANVQPNQAIVTTDSIYMTLGEFNAVYRIPLP